MVQRVLVPVDGSAHSRRALEVTLEEFPDAEVVVFHAIDRYDVALVSEPAVWDDEFPERQERAAEALLEEYRDLADGHGVEVRTELARGKPADAILVAVDEFGADHVVMGSRGRRGVARVLLGSVAEKVARRAPVSVTVVRPPET
ncbi:universal stress protein [Natronobiforma cellulositropha]|uniref:universal stress protein n=1 Tax=Natronobiforma cellulositropha TaxID=1679076 RepID=UPI0021D590B5|nr:universal stress protein [Natronobiforma cellulositropha]